MNESDKSDGVAKAQIAKFGPTMQAGAGSILIGIALLAWNARVPGFIGATLLAVVASAGVGALTGFLFGIPRALAAPRAEVRPKTAAATSAASDEEREGDAAVDSPFQRAGISENTNLEQISDWLTKIIVGVGLVESQRLAAGLASLSASLAKAWDLPNGQVVAGCVIVASCLLGFLGTYIWTRTDFVLYLVSNRNLIGELMQRAERAKREERSADTALRKAVEYATGSASAQRIRGPRRERERDERARAGVADPRYQEVWDSDPNKGQFGSQATANGKRLSARVERLADDRNVYGVALKVETLEGSPNISSVRFYLHPTFSQPEFDLPAVGGVVELKFLALEAFTVGAQTDDGTRLELDLEDVPNLPEGFSAK